MRRRMFHFLIWLANKVNGSKNYYDFGEPIVVCQVFLDRLYVGTRGSIYRKNKTNDGWKKVS